MFLRYIWSRSCAVVKPLCCKVWRVKYVLVYLQQSDYKTLYRSSHLRVFWYFQGVDKKMHWEQRHLWFEDFGHYSIWFCTIMYNNLIIKIQIIVGRTLPKFQKIRSIVTNMISRLHWRKHTYSNLGTNMLDKIFRKKWKNKTKTTLITVLG